MRMILLLTAALAAWAAPPARGETVTTCTGFVRSLPATIGQGGTWCLDGDLATSMSSGNAITIAANNVTLDCNGFKLGGLGAGPATTAVGIATQSSLNTVVRNCNVRGFRFGIVGSGGGGYLVERNRIERSTLAGIFLLGPGVVRDNHVHETGGAGSSAIGIAVGDAADVLDNIVADVTTTPTGGFSYGIVVSGSIGGLVERNVVRGLRTVAGFVYGIYLATSSDRVLVRENDVMSVQSETGGKGIFCQSGESSTLLHGNSMLFFVDGWSGCRDGGRNVEVLP